MSSPQKKRTAELNICTDNSNELSDNADGEKPAKIRKTDAESGDSKPPSFEKPNLTIVAGTPSDKANGFGFQSYTNNAFAAAKAASNPFAIAPSSAPASISVTSAGSAENTPLSSLISPKTAATLAAVKNGANAVGDASATAAVPTNSTAGNALGNSSSTSTIPGSSSSLSSGPSSGTNSNGVSPRVNPFSSTSPARNPFMSIVEKQDDLWKAFSRHEAAAAAASSSGSAGVSSAEGATAPDAVAADAKECAEPSKDAKTDSSRPPRDDAPTAAAPVAVQAASTATSFSGGGFTSFAAAGGAGGSIFTAALAASEGHTGIGGGGLQAPSASSATSESASTTSLLFGKTSETASGGASLFGSSFGGASGGSVALFGDSFGGGGGSSSGAGGGASRSNKRKKSQGGGAESGTNGSGGSIFASGAGIAEGSSTSSRNNSVNNSDDENNNGGKRQCGKDGDDEDEDDASQYSGGDDGDDVDVGGGTTAYPILGNPAAAGDSAAGSATAVAPVLETGEENESNLYQVRSKLFRLGHPPGTNKSAPVGVALDRHTMDLPGKKGEAPGEDNSKGGSASSAAAADAGTERDASDSSTSVRTTPLEWVEIGTGPLKVLRSTESICSSSSSPGSSSTTHRCVLRREMSAGGPGTKVLLNVLLQPEVVSVTKMGDKAVRLTCLEYAMSSSGGATPGVSAPEGSEATTGSASGDASLASKPIPVTYLIKMKSAQEIDKLLEVLNPILAKKATS